MKKIFVILVVFVLGFSARAQYVTIPDDNLRTFMMGAYPSCFNASNMLDTTCPAIINETILHLYSLGDILNWDGFQYFRNLQLLNCTDAWFTSLPTLPNTLIDLRIDNMGHLISLPTLPNGLKYLHFMGSAGSAALNVLPLLPNSLIYLDCSYHSQLQLPSALPSSLRYFNGEFSGLSSLPALPATLDTLICNTGNLSVLPSLPSTLIYLDCMSNNITTLPVLPGGLKILMCNNNPLSSLPTALPAQLELLNAGSNQQITSVPPLPVTLKYLALGSAGITTLPTLPVGLEHLEIGGCSISSISAIPSLIDFDCTGCQLTSLPTLPLTLMNLHCGGNLLTSLPLLPDNMEMLVCNNNQLTSLPPLPQSLRWFDCSNNQIYFMPPLPGTLTHIFCTHNNITCLPVLADQPGGPWLEMDSKINCLPNFPPGLYMFVYDSATNTPGYYTINEPYPLCSAVNNINHCNAFPLVTGHVFYDNNNNLIKDVNEPYKANAKIQLSNGAYTITNSNGYYQIPADSIGNYNISITPPNYFTSVPLQYNYTFNAYDTLVTGDFALQATSVRDSLSISILPINWAARPGFPFPYLISYQNVGTTTLSPNIIFNYDNSRLIYDSSSNAAVTNSGSALSLSEPGFVAGDQKAFVGYFTVKPAAVIGDSIHVSTSIHANAITAYDSTATQIRGSFDPNDKSATPVLSPSQVANGNYIYYTIRFQNTGTDTAFSVVITDTLNSQLQAATLQVINTSHPAKITVKGNVVYFEFINMLLPDSNVNEMKSHGYVSFRIKPQPTVTLNSIIPNKAAIYFDYNSPVITNTALTNIVNPVIIVPLKLISFNVVRSMGNNANAFWNTSNEINVQSYNIEMSVDGRYFSSISYEKAKGYPYNDYTKMIAIPNNDILYFRLKMTDVDGRFTYSPIVTLRNDQSQSFSFSTNPVKDVLKIAILDGELKNTFAKIYNAQGALIKKILLQQGVESINVKALAAGVYVLVTEKGSRQFIVVK